jgi:D-alanine-D-alanine ligase
MALKIAVLMGGTSAERDVSLITGQEIAAALRKSDHQVLAIDCAYGDLLIKDLNKEMNEVIRPEHSDFEDRKRELDRNLFKTIDFLNTQEIDVAFIALHGGYGENGQLQALLELAGILYTGSDSLSSAVGMDKYISKTLFRQVDIPVPDSLKLDSSEYSQQSLEALGFPLVIKPNNQGSTVGLTIVEDTNHLKSAIETAHKYSKSILAEKFIAGKEVTVAILDQQALPVIEIKPEHGIYDYECKYQTGKSKYIVPAELDLKITQYLQDLALKAFNALGCRHYARVDFRLSDEGTPYCLEVNTLPGMTSTSLVPKAAKAIGIQFPELIERIVQLAIS